MRPPDALSRLWREAEDDGLVVELPGAVGQLAAVVSGDLEILIPAVGLLAGIHSADESCFSEAAEMAAHQIGVAVGPSGQGRNGVVGTVRQGTEGSIATGLG